MFFLTLRPLLRRPVRVPNASDSTKNQAPHRAPWTAVHKKGVDGPTQPSSDNQRSQQLGSDPNCLAEPRIKRIL